MASGTRTNAGALDLALACSASAPAPALGLRYGSLERSSEPEAAEAEAEADGELSEVRGVDSKLALRCSAAKRAEAEDAEPAPNAALSLSSKERHCKSRTNRFESCRRLYLRHVFCTQTTTQHTAQQIVSGRKREGFGS
jgi:hypothetical protein